MSIGKMVGDIYSTDPVIYEIPTNQEWMNTLKPEEWYLIYDWLMHKYSSRFIDSRLAIIDWLKSRDTEAREYLEKMKIEFPYCIY